MRRRRAEDAGTAQVTLVTPLFLLQVMHEITVLVLFQIAVRSSEERLRVAAAKHQIKIEIQKYIL